ncbi:non-hydrolyzing UDP-N-acetylglucosamine 2-epimerase [Streptomyces varsoviensis]|uniref:non-hydrolyzing UDP-N-acetylglucosamine 2-epimerase n=1 Tax=Streptomyces varsoviensis TaxID=67373 RepID=UPI00248065F9|nr:UDP-N-acetylglucosamine 2-epimerase (non-hydrolyzing) [Streptomyces varsoviensis]
MVLGTRPEMIKLASVIALLGVQAATVHTGQHFNSTMSEHIGTGLNMPPWSMKLGIGGTRRGSQLGVAIASLDDLFAAERPTAVVVQGDTNSALAGAIAANAHAIPLIHVEAGLRSFDRRMPEESNRVLTDHLADMCCAPTELNRRNLLREGIPPERIVVTGNTVVEAVSSALPDRTARLATARRFELVENQYVLATLHRPENVDDETTLRHLLTELASLPAPVVLPLHPRTQRQVAEFGLEHLLRRLTCTEPLVYRDFVALAHGAALVVSDSGGLQEEVTVLKRPIVVVRRSTERPEIEGVFGTLAPPGPGLGAVLREWLATAGERRERLVRLPSPYGDGMASSRVTRLIKEQAALPPGPSSTAA